MINNKPASEIETTILIIPQLLTDFYDYLDYLEFANDLIFALHLEGVVQIASFHPNYQFAGTEKEDITNYTNRSPFPLLHLLREESISDALAHYQAPQNIPERNMETMKALGKVLLEKIINNR